MLYVKLPQEILHSILYSRQDLGMGLSSLGLVKFKITKNCLKIWVMLEANGSGHRPQDFVALDDQRTVSFQIVCCLDEMHSQIGHYRHFQLQQLSEVSIIEQGDKTITCLGANVLILAYEWLDIAKVPKALIDDFPTTLPPCVRVCAHTLACQLSPAKLC